MLISQPVTLHAGVVDAPWREQLLTDIVLLFLILCRPFLSEPRGATLGKTYDARISNQSTPYLARSSSTQSKLVVAACRTRCISK